MNEAPIPQMSGPAPKKPDHVVAITAIIAIAFVSLVCIAGTAAVIVTAIMNSH